MAKANEKVISMHYVAILLQLLKNKGVAPKAVLAGSRVSEIDCQSHDGVLSFDQFNRVIENALALSRIPELGLHFGKQLNLTAHGDMGLAMMSSENIQQALEIGVQYLAIRNPLIRLNYSLSKHQVSLGVHLQFAKGETKRFLLDMTMASIHCMRTFLLGQEAGACEVQLNYLEPGNRKIYDLFFNHQVRFSSSNNAYAFPLHELQMPLPLADPLTREVAENRCKMKLEALSRKTDWASKVKQLLLSRPGHLPNLNEVAAKLFVSPRTLRRHLESENTAFQSILTQLRHDLAEDYLSSTGLTVSEIANLLNYSDPSNFANAFKKRSGSSPLKFREKASQRKK